MRKLLPIVLLALATPAQAQEWPGWRGPRGDGRSEESSFPLRWSATENVLWRVPLPGKGHSSPIVWGDRIFVTACDETTGERSLICLERGEGRTLWSKVLLTAPMEHKHGLNSFASSTPLTDGKRLWVAFFQEPRFVILCLDLDGRELWRKSPGEFHSVHGFCSSPVLYRDLVIFNGDQDADAWIVALDRETGEERWRAERPNKTRSYVPPVIFEAAGKAQMVLSGSKCVASYDPASGRQHWIIDGPTEQFVASTVFTEGIFFITGGFPQHHLLAIRPDGEGNVTKTHILWRDKDPVSYVPSPIAWESMFYVVSDGGFVGGFDAKTGKRSFKERLGPHHSASPVAAGGYLYFPDDRGTTHVLKAGPGFEVVAKNALGEDCYASPALSRGRIYFRGAKSLFCIGERGN